MGIVRRNVLKCRVHFVDITSILFCSDFLLAPITTYEVR
jgi:hypothetical protein